MLASLRIWAEVCRIRHREGRPIPPSSLDALAEVLEKAARPYGTHLCAAETEDCS